MVRSFSAMLQHANAAYHGPADCSRPSYHMRVIPVPVTCFQRAPSFSSRYSERVRECADIHYGVMARESAVVASRIRGRPV